MPDAPFIRKKEEVKLEIFAALCKWKVVDESAKLLSPIPRLITKRKLGKSYCQDLYKKVVVKGSVANGKSTGRPKEYGPELWGEFEKIHEEIQNQTKCKPRSEAIQTRLAEQFNHVPCAETIRRATKDRYETKACVQKPIASLRTRGERNAFAAAEAALWRQRGFAVPEQP